MVEWFVSLKGTGPFAQWKQVCSGRSCSNAITHDMNRQLKKDHEKQANFHADHHTLHRANFGSSQGILRRPRRMYEFQVTKPL